MKKKDDIQKLRSTHEWEKVELALKKYETSKKKDETFLLIVQGELALRRENFEEAQKILLSVVSEGRHNQESRALLGVVHFKQNNYDASISNLEILDVECEISNLEAGRFVEALLVKGECLEHLGRKKDAILAYEECIRLAERTFEKVVPSSIKKDTSKAWFRTAALHANTDRELDLCIYTLRSMMQFPLGLDKDIKKEALLLYSHILLHKCTPQNYPEIEEDSSSSSKYTPKDEVEEALFTLLELEKESAPIVEDESTLVFDNLCLAYCRRYAFSSSIAAFERSLALRFEDHHLWFQFAFALVSAQKYQRALFVLRECISLEPTNPVILLLAAKVCINELYLPKDAIEFAKIAVRHGGEYMARSYQTLGVAYGMLADTLISGEERREMQIEALNALHKSYSLDPNDGGIVYQLARQYADIRETDKAIVLVKEALQLSTELENAWNLFALLLSAKRMFNEALQVCSLGLKKNKVNTSLLETKAKLEGILGDSCASLKTYKEAFSVLKKQLQESGIEYKVDKQQVSNSEATQDIRFRSISVVGLEATQSHLSSQDSNMRRRSWDLSSIAGGADGTTEYNQIATNQFTDLWVAVAEAFMSLGKYNEARECLDLTKSSTILSPIALYQEGLLEEVQGNKAIAKEIYEEVLSVGANHYQTLIRLGALYRDYDKNLLIAENAFSTAVRNESTRHEAWFQLGMVLKEKGENVRAAECFQTAMELEETAPVLPYSRVKRAL